ncbi:phage/plasmid primase, P4 family [Kitasatospora sp. NPDC002965]|uniref:DNA primase family protein n=1 Tax=Kitasatospora sp. NPDC002965 TaxID=3154775 RepID=UPI00339EB29E
MLAFGLELDGAQHPAEMRTEPLPLRAQQRTSTQPGSPLLLPESLSDLGNAELFARTHANAFRHVEGIGWYVWQDYRWKRTGGEKAVIRAAGRMAQRIPENDPTGQFPTRALRKHRTRSMSTPGIKAFLVQATATEELSLEPDMLDGDPYALCTPGGVVDLRTGLIHAPDPAKDLHSRSTSVTPAPMPTPRWGRFLADTFGGNDDAAKMVKFLQLLLGYSITGDVGAQILPFLYGPGANGKSVLLDVAQQLLGDYADAAPPGFLMDRKFEEHSTELADLHGRRIFVCSELKPDDKWDEARVKYLTGGDTIKARRMRQDFFTFTPTHKLWLLGNHKPEVSTGGFAFWRRIRLVPFTRVVPPERKIDNLAELLVQEEGPGILQWMVDGAITYLATRDPLDGPASVRLATQAYQSTEDHIGRFLRECCSQGGEAIKVEQGSLYAAYRDWCAGEEGVRISTARAFAGRIRTELNIPSPDAMPRSNGRRYYPGLALLHDDE